MIIKVIFYIEYNKHNFTIYNIFYDKKKLVDNRKLKILLLFEYEFKVQKY
jgi:hypothetical protein